MSKQREHWGSSLGFVLAAAGSAIGLGTLWKFPYVTGNNGGGLFVLIYMASIFLIGIPLFVTELVLGRKGARGAVGVFGVLSKNNTFWKLAGWFGVASSFLIMTYYSVIAGWGLNYVLMSLSRYTDGKSPEEIAGVFDIVQSSPDITLFWQAVFILMTVGVVYRGIRNGIEYWSKIMTTGLLIIASLLCVYCTQLSGFPRAFTFLFSAHASDLTPIGVLEALGLSFFTLSLGQGIMITYGSYLKKSEDIPKTALVIGLTIVIVAILASLTIFSILFSFDQSVQGGAGLVFKALPLLFSKIPGSMLVSTTFFILFVFAGLTSAVSLVEVVASNLMDVFDWTRKKSVLIVGLASFIFGVPSALSGTGLLFSNWTALYGRSFFDTIDMLVSVWLIQIGGFLTVLFAGWFFDPRVLEAEFKEGSNLRFLWRPWVFFLRYVAPLAIGAIMLHSLSV